MKKVIITREKKQGEKTARLLEKYGLEAVIFPTIKFEPLSFPVEKIKKADVVIFSSQNGVRFFMEQFSPDLLKEKVIIATGEKTGEKLKEYGIKEYILPDRYDSSGVAQLIKKSKKMKGKRIALIRPLEGLDTTVKIVGEYAKVETVPVYRTVINIPENREEVKKRIHSGEIDYIVFSSPSTFINFTKIFPQEWRNLLKILKIGVIGKTTAKALEEKGIKPDIIPEKFTMEELAKKIRQQADPD
ncbi:uroporphyrinogen-III synthase [Persephonella atlantica]|uniref:Uroporphyrinogen-III synthase n=1 Tax=Persephonella atlantica TaxID=2699429 RepID=A0ABS1GFS7_9AQUI|nr:uroporphyrinogen-III synthase [Persephonella atlantica]MBK3331772.1 uroporphyrinogen-III synthase [Persephonella atlantica]